MPTDSDRYTTLSIRKGLKDDLERLKDSNETYGDVLQRAIASEREVREEVESRLDHLTTVQNQQSRLLVRMAVEMGVEKEQIPKNLAEYEAWGADNPFATAEEETVDLHADEKRARWQARKEVLDLERGEDGFLRPQGEEGDRARVHITEEQEELIEQRTVEIIDEENAGGTPPWETDNGGDN